MHRSTIAAQSHVNAPPLVPYLGGAGAPRGHFAEGSEVAKVIGPEPEHEAGGSKEKGEATLRDILAQPNAWRQALEAVEGTSDDIRALLNNAEAPVFAGSGSDFNVAVILGQVAEKALGKPAVALPLGELALDSKVSLRRSDALVVVARSSEDAWAARVLSLARRAGIPSVVISTGPAGDCGSSYHLALEFLREESSVPTKSFTGLALAGLALMLGSQSYVGELPNYGTALLRMFRQSIWRIMNKLAEGCPESRLSRYVFVASPPYMGVAMEGQFYMLRMAGAPSCWLRAAEFEVGYQNMVDDSTLVVVLSSDCFRDLELGVGRRAREIGARSLVICDASDGSLVRDHHAADRMVEVSHRLKGSAAAEACRGLLYSLILQLLSYYAAIARGLDPDLVPS